MSGAPNRARASQPLLLADQLIAWSQYRQGWCVNDIGVVLGRLPRETRAILHGGAA